MERGPHPRSALGATVLVASAALAAAGCGSILGGEDRQDVREVSLAAFSTPPTGQVPEVVGIPIEDVQPPSTEEIVSTDVNADGTKVTTRKEEVTALDPATQKTTTRTIDQGQVQTVRVGQRWPVESLVGQINGRPIFANEFFATIEARILQIVANPNPQRAKAELEALVRDRFNNLVSSELVLAEAESRLTPEMKQGLLSWIRDIQEQTIAQRGGTRTSAEEALREETGQGVEQMVNARKNEALIGDILRRKVQPRVIVSWRDIERRYEQGRAEFSPDPTYKVARIRLSTEVEADKAKAEQVRRMIAEKVPFERIADAVGVPNHGAWSDRRVRDGRMDVADLNDELAKVLQGLLPGMVSEPIVRSNSVTWYSIVGSTVPPSVSVFDPMLQLQLRQQLMGERESIETRNYLASLRRRWLSSSIAKMEVRLQKMARDRYLDPLKFR